MFIVSMTRVIKTAITSLWRNRWLSLASTLVMIITLIIISVFVSLTIIANKITNALEEKIDMAVYIEESASSEQIFALQKIVLKRNDVLEAYYVSKEEALERWQERNKDNEDIRNVISEDDNPLPRSLEIRTKTPEDLEEIAQMLERQEYASLVKELSYHQNKNMIERLVNIADFIKLSGWILSAVFILISILVIYNTIRLTIFARSEEIEIMKLVGSTDWYVRGPFIFEGIAYGIMATAISSILVFTAFEISIPWAQGYLGGFDLGGGYLGVSFWMVVVLQLGVSIILGMTCSIVAIKKHLK